MTPTRPSRMSSTTRPADQPRSPSERSATRTLLGGNSNRDYSSGQRTFGVRRRERWSSRAHARRQPAPSGPTRLGDSPRAARVRACHQSVAVSSARAATAASTRWAKSRRCSSSPARSGSSDVDRHLVAPRHPLALRQDPPRPLQVDGHDRHVGPDRQPRRAGTERPAPPVRAPPTLGIEHQAPAVGQQLLGLLARPPRHLGALDRDGVEDQRGTAPPPPGARRSGRRRHPPRGGAATGGAPPGSGSPCRRDCGGC